MPVEYVEFAQARSADGLRMVVVTGVPSPWGEAAKGILHVKQIPWLAVRLDQGSDELADWTKPCARVSRHWMKSRPRPSTRSF